MAIIEGLDEDQRHTLALLSGGTPIGLILHLAGAEAMWFQWDALGRQPQVTWTDGIDDAPYDPEAPFNTVNVRSRTRSFDREIYAGPYWASLASTGRMSPSPIFAGSSRT